MLRSATRSIAPRGASMAMSLRSSSCQLSRLPSSSSFSSSVVRDIIVRRSAFRPNVAAIGSVVKMENSSRDSRARARARATASLVASAAAAAAAATISAVTFCSTREENDHFVGKAWRPNNLSEVNITVAADDPTSEPLEIETLPVFTADQVAMNNGKDGKPVWMSYGGVVYDVTGFIANHPGGSEKILQASGGAIEPFWHLYRQHYASDLPMKLLEHMIVGRLDESDQEAIDDKMSALMENDPYAREPDRHASLIVHSDAPMSAEVPAKLITENYFTPNSLFYVRNHHPVPFMTPSDVQDFRLVVDLSAYGKGTLELSLEDLKKLPKTEVTATLQCSGNRRHDFNQVKRTSGTSWAQGAISTAKWGGVRLSEILKLAGLQDPHDAQERGGIEHVRFYSMDGMKTSIGIEKAMNPYGDCLVTYEMNGAPLTRDHGFPLRMLVPGFAAVRSAKWLNRIELSSEEAEGPWQRGLNYKILPSTMTDAGGVDLSQMPSVNEVSVYSGISKLEVAPTPTPPSSSGGEIKTMNRGKKNGTNTRDSADTKSQGLRPGDTVMIRASGWAFAGGGRGVVRVLVTADAGETWATATLTEGRDQRIGRAWAWVFWECDVPAVVRPDHTVEVASSATDSSFNVQPERCDHSWNVRGLGNNSWFRSKLAISKPANVEPGRSELSKKRVYKRSQLNKHQELGLASA